MPARAYLGRGVGSDADPKIVFDVVGQKNGDPDEIEGWEPYDFVLPKETVPTLVTRRAARWWLPVAGREPLARAFLEAGYDGYVSATEEYVSADSALLFAIGFFYNLLAEERDYAPKIYTDREATERAASMDSDFDEGTRPYRYWGAEDFTRR